MTHVHTRFGKCNGEKSELVLHGVNFPDAEPWAPRRGGSWGGALGGVRAWVHVRACPLLAPSVCLFVPRHRHPRRGSARSLSASSTRTQGAATAPTRGPKTPPEQILGDNRAPTWDALQLPKPLPEA